MSWISYTSNRCSRSRGWRKSGERLGESPCLPSVATFPQALAQFSALTAQWNLRVENFSFKTFTIFGLRYIYIQIFLFVDLGYGHTYVLFRQFLCAVNVWPGLRASAFSGIRYFYWTIYFGGYSMSVFRNLSFLFNAQVVYRYITIYLSSVLFVDI